MAKIDLNNVDLTKVEARPIIRDSVVEVQCVKVEVKSNKAGTGQVMNLHLKTVNEQTNTKGNPVGAGHLLFHTVSITPTEKYDEEAIARQLVEIQLGFLGEKTPEFDTDDIMMKVAKAKVSYENTAEYGEQNRIKGFIVKES